MKRTGKMKLLALVLAVVLVFGMMPGSLTNAAAKTAETEVVEETSPADDETFVESETEDVTEDETETTAEDAAEPEAEDAGENAGATMEENPAADPEEETTAPEEESEPAEEDYGIQTLDVLQGVTYVDENGEVQTTTADVDVTELTSSTTTWNEGWYVVNRNVSISGTRVAVSGEVHLILADGCTLTVGRGIQVSGDNTLYIYGQTEGTGALSITSPSTYSAGIGSNGVTSGTDTTGTIIINGGVINAKGGSYGSGIGGGTCGSSGEITINGGTVTASGGNGNYQYGGGSGIGSGSKGSCGEITINGGTVTASGGNGSYGGSGIGSSYYGSGGTITINGGTVTAKGGSYSAGIGTGLVGEKITINITGGTINATGSSEGEAAGIGQGSAFKSSTYRDMGTINITGGTVYASAGWAAACIGTGEYTKGGTINISGGTVVTSSGHTGIGHGSGTSGNMTFTTGENGHAVIYTDDINVTGSKSSWSGLISSSSATGDALVYGSPEFTSEESIPSGKTVRIEAGKTLTVAEGDTFTNNGDLYLDYGYEGISDACINSDETTIYYEIVNNEIDVEGAEAHSDRVYAKSGDELSATSMEDGSELLEYTGEKQSGEPLEVKEDLSFTMPAEPVELKPVVREFTLQYNANGGDGEVPKNQTVLNNADNKYVTIASGKGLTKNEWKDPFAAWNTESDGSGTLYVEGDEFELNESTTLYAQYPHEHNYHDNDYSDGFCRCGFYEPADWDDTEERYEIGNLGQLYWFMSLVNGDASLAEFTTDDTNRGASANAALTADIGTIENPVEQNFTAYGGNFDGQGYTITLKLNGNTETALFATTNGASICNLYTAGTIEASGKYAAGIVGEVSGNFTMKCCISSVEINSSVNGDGTHGGLVANLTSGCPEFTVEDCAFTGSIIGDTTTKCGGIVGYKNGTPSGIIKNCWTTGTFELGSSDSDSETIVRNGPSNIENCYYLDPIRSGSTQGTQKDADEFASGEVTWLLNGGVVKEDGTIDQDATTDGSQAWYQNLSNGEDRDDTPVLEQHGTVYGGYAEDSCILCYSNSELSPEAVHSLGEGKAEVPATCEETGTKACYQCEACERYFEDADATKWLSEDDIIIPALGHDYDYEKATFKWTTADESGYTVTATAVCTRDEEHICDPIDCTVSSVVTKPGSCKEPGSITYTATLTVNGVTYASDEKTDELPIMGSVTAEDYSVTYDGEAHGIIVTVALNDDVPEGYTITYSEDEDGEYTEFYPEYTVVGTYTVYYKVSKDNYEDVYGSETFTISKATNNALSIDEESLNKTYDGDTVEPEITADFGAETVKYIWYRVNGDESETLDMAPSDAGIYKVVATIAETANYVGATTEEIGFTIYPKSITKDMFDVDTADETYTGVEITKEITSNLVEGTDYKVSYKDNVNAGTATITITGIGNYTGTVEYTFTINKVTYDMSGVSFEDASYIYDGAEHDITITGNLPTGVTVSYKDNTRTNVGSQTATASFTGDADNYELIADMTATLTITAQTITKGMFKVDTNDEIYIGTEITKTITSDLKKDTDYTVSYDNNINAGTAVITITGKGNYTGELIYTFTIEKAAQDISYAVLELTKLENAHAFTNELKETTVSTDTDAGITYTSSNKEVAVVDADTGEVNIDGTGTTTITATAKGTANFAEATASYTLTVVTPEETVTSDIEDQTYSGDEIHLRAVVSHDDAGDADDMTYSYQWYKDGELIEGATEEILTLRGEDVGVQETLYTCDVTMHDSYFTETVTASISVTILKAESNNLTILTESLDKTYDGTAVKNPEVTADFGTDTVTFTWYAVDENGKVTDVLSKAPSDAGNYKVVASVAETENYVGATAEMTFTIKKSAQIISDPETKSASKSSAIGTTATSGGITYKVTSNTEAAVTKTNKNSTSVTIPATVKVNGKSYKVTSISDKACSGNTKLKKVTIGSNVTSIGANAFAKCTNLKKVTIGKNVTKIGKKAFFKCKSLKKVIVKTKKLKSVGAKAFKGIKKNAKFKVPKNKKKAYKKLLNKKAGIKKTMKIK